MSDRKPVPGFNFEDEYLLQNGKIQDYIYSLSFSLGEN